MCERPQKPMWKQWRTIRNMLFGQCARFSVSQSWIHTKTIQSSILWKRNTMFLWICQPDWEVFSLSSLAYSVFICVSLFWEKYCNRSFLTDELNKTSGELHYLIVNQSGIIGQSQICNQKWFRMENFLSFLHHQIVAWRSQEEGMQFAMTTQESLLSCNVIGPWENKERYITEIIPEQGPADVTFRGREMTGRNTSAFAG